MKVSKAYILRINRPESIEYSETAAKSCDDIELPYEFVEGWDSKELKTQKRSVWDELREHGVKIKGGFRNDGGSCATAGHFLIWKKILDNEECAVILEHDAIMLYYPMMHIVNNEMVMLGYKCRDPENYDHVTAGPPTEIHQRKKHGGAHAYAINHVTAKSLLDVLSERNSITYIDNDYMFNDRGRGKVQMGITNPISAIGWLRDSTIWAKSAVDNYAPILDSFLKNYHSKQSLEIKK